MFRTFQSALIILIMVFIRMINNQLINILVSVWRIKYFQTQKSNSELLSCDHTRELLSST